MPPDTERDRKVLTEIRHSSLEALTDMRELIDVLRTFSTDHDPISQEPLALPETLRRFRSAGLTITLPKQTEHTLVEMLNRLDPAVAQLLTQLIQEALTNAIKHGNGTANLQCEHHDDRIACTITNPIGTAQSPNVASLSGGLGLGAMAAAVHHAQGRFSTGATQHGSAPCWRVHVDLPTPTASVTETSRNTP